MIGALKMSIAATTVGDAISDPSPLAAGGGPKITAGNALNFFKTIGKLKTLKRTGWVNHGTTNAYIPDLVFGTNI